MKNEEVNIPSFHSREGNLVRILRQNIRHTSDKVYSEKHTEIEIMVFRTGYGKIKTSCGEYAVIPGDVFIFRSNENHCIELADADKSADVISLMIAPQIILESKGFPDYDILQRFVNKNQRISNRLDRENPMIEKIKELIFEIECEFSNESCGYSLMIKNKAETIFILLTRHFFEETGEEEMIISKSTFGSIEDSMDYIDEHLTDALKLEHLAEVANMSKTHYTTTFKKVNGISPWEYIISKRIDLAISLMSDSRMTVLELALKSGFNSTANFNRAFKRCTGKTPTEFKAQMNII